jgi:cysteine desulfurase
MKNKVYLDYNATTPLRAEVITLMTSLMHAPHNASSVHSFGREGRKAIEHAREQIAALVNAPAAQIIFNSGATEGNNTVLNHFKNERILVSSIEHPSVLEAAPDAQRIPVTKDGIVDLAALETLLKKEKPALVSVMAVNNETGIIQPIEKISALAHSNGALFHCDGVQAAGRITLDIAKMGIDFLTLSAHKIGGPQGVGALVLGLCGITPTLLHGGGQEKRARAGTENVAGIAGFGLAAELAHKELPQQKNLAALRDRLEKNLSAVIHGKNAPRIAGTSLFSLAGLSSETLIMAFDLEFIALSNGSACSSGRVEPSHVLKAMQVDAAHSAAALRVSLGWNSTDADIDAFLNVWEKITTRLKDKIRA